MPEVEYPDGTIVEFPDGTPDLTMQAISSRFYDNNSQVFNYNPQPFEHGMFINPLEGVPEAFAKGVYEAPGQLAAIYDQFSPWATFTQAITGKSLQQSFDDVTGNSALPYNPDDYGASKLVQSIARLSGNVVGDPLNAAPIGMVGKTGVMRGTDNLMKPNTLNKQAGVVGIDDLPMDEASRMQRAKDEGFNTDNVYYHGTRADIKEFDPLFLGDKTKASSAKKAYFLSKSPKVASGYSAIGDSRHVIELKKTLKNKVKESRDQGIDFPASDVPEIKKLFEEIKNIEMFGDVKAQKNAEGMGELSYFSNGSTVYPVQAKIRNPYIYDYKGGNYRDKKYTDIIDIAKAKGHDGVIFKNTYDGGSDGYNELTDIVAVFEPSQIRSINAVFDPAKKNSSNLLAGGAGAGTYMVEEKKKRNIK